MVDPSKPVRVFRNWKHHCYTIMQGGVVYTSARAVLLDDVEFLVREAGRQRMLANGKKNVHAYAVGTLVDFAHPDDDRSIGVLEGRIAWYDPHRYPTFVDKASHEPVLKAALVQLDERGITYAARPEQALAA